MLHPAEHALRPRPSRGSATAWPRCTLHRLPVLTLCVAVHRCPHGSNANRMCRQLLARDQLRPRASGRRRARREPWTQPLPVTLPRPHQPKVTNFKTATKQIGTASDPTATF
jgi:hypothetical protein